MDNYRMKGYYRDKKIIDYIENYRCLNSEQIEFLLFKGMKSGKRKCQQRLKKLYDQKKVKRWRYSLEESYAYYIELKSKVEQMEHLINLNWIIVWFENNLNSWEKIYHLKYEINFEILRCDCFIIIKNIFSNEYKMYFIEMDIAKSNNRFDKIKKYNELYGKINFYNLWWRNLTDRFPGILIVSTNSKKIKKIKEDVKSYNDNDLEFIVKDLDQIKLEVKT